VALLIEQGRHQRWQSLAAVFPLAWLDANTLIAFAKRQNRWVLLRLKL
jgi:hypothetical protein